MEKKIKKDTSWESVAGWYDDLLAQDDTYQTQVVLPNLLRLVAPQGRQIADIACGQGFFAKAFVEAGATRVYGADLSPELIATAKRNTANAVDAKAMSISPEKLTFVVAPANELSDVPGESFDVVTTVLALQNIKDLAGTMREAARLLKKGGKYIVVLNHPCFRIPKASSWGFDEKKEIQFRRIDGYGRPSSVEVDMTPGERSSDKKVYTVSFHRPLQDYFKAFAAAHLSVVGLEEWISHKKSEPGPRAKAEDRARVEFPMFMTIVAQK